MSGDKCSYFGCRNNRRNTNGSIIFHPFPSKEEMYKIWIINSGNIKLDSLSPKKLKKTYICSSHFNKKDYSNPAAPKSRLNRNAVPKSYLDETENIDEHKLDSTQNETCTNTTAKRKLMFDEDANVQVGKTTTNDLTPTKSQKLGKHTHDNVIFEEEKIPFGTKFIQDFSPKELRLLTPKKLFSKEPKNVSVCDVSQNYFGSPTFSASPGTKSFVSQLIQLPSPNNKTSHEKKTMKYEQLLEMYEKQKIMSNKLLARKRAKIHFLKKQLNKKQKQEKLNPKSFIEKTKFVSKNSKSLVSMQLLHKKRKPWLQNEKNLATSIFYKSPAAYKFMRKSNIILPGVSTLHTWLKALQYKPGFSPEYMTQLKMMCKTMSPKEKKCVVMVDEMAIKHCLEYNKSLDMIEGYEDLGHLGRTKRPAKLAFVIMIRGLYHKWKLPMSYFLSSTGVKGDQMAQIMKDCILELIKIGFDPVCITCDQGTANRKMFSTFNATPDKPYTFIEGKKIYLIFDVPHLIKSIRNNLLNGDILLKTLEGLKTIRFHDFKNTYEIDKTSSTARAMCKIGEEHINPNPWQKMSCKIAIQTFSNSVSAAIKTSVATGQLDSSTALDTANFFLEINNLFDALNSKNVFDKNRLRRPMCENNPNVLNTIKNSIIMFKNAEKLSFKNVSRKNPKKDIPPCFTGMIWTLNAVIDLYESEKSEMLLTMPSTNFFLMTNRLCQDPIENLFSIFRQKGGYCKNPTCRTLRCSFASVCSFGLLNCASEKSNCEEDEDTFIASSEIATDMGMDIENDRKDEEINNQITNYIEIDNDEEEEEETPNESSLEKCSILYYAGYLAKKCLDKFNCKLCQKCLLKSSNSDEKDQLLITNKTFKHIQLNSHSGLNIPSDNLKVFVQICLNVFKQNFCNIKSEQHLVVQLMTEANRKIPDNIVQPECTKHWDYIMKLLFIVKIFKECKWSSKISKFTTPKPNQKLKILKHL